MGRQVVAIVGRPNVGKSSLFNALAGEKIAIVQDTPGVTRDRIYADVTWLDKQFSLIDTGGIEMDTSDVILSHMRTQAEIAIETADVIIFMTDVKQGVTDADYHVIAGTDAGEIMHHVVPGHVQGLGSGFGQFASPVYPVIHQPGTGSQANGAHVF